MNKNKNDMIVLVELPPDGKQLRRKSKEQSMGF
jgi:hypothetical protein